MPEPLHGLAARFLGDPRKSLCGESVNPGHSATVRSPFTCPHGERTSRRICSKPPGLRRFGLPGTLRAVARAVASTEAHAPERFGRGTADRALASALPPVWLWLGIVSGLLALLEPTHDSRANVAVSVIEPQARSDAWRDSERTSGVLSVLTYNVAGLPGVFSGSDPERNVPRVSPLLNPYDVVLGQEDFSYHRELVESVEHAYQRAPSRPRFAFLGDGLVALSKLPIEADTRVRWTSCSGYLLDQADCLADKGFFAFDLRVSRRTVIRIYNLHGDAGRGAEDVAARRHGFRQLAEHLRAHAASAPVIVAGDTNLDEADPHDMRVLSEFLARTGLQELCRQFVCRGPNLDRVLYRGSREIDLFAVGWHSDERFVDEGGRPLSDHLPMVARLGWRVRQQRQDRSPGLQLARE